MPELFSYTIFPLFSLSLSIPPLGNRFNHPIRQNFLSREMSIELHVSFYYTILFYEKRGKKITNINESNCHHSFTHGWFVWLNDTSWTHTSCRSAHEYFQTRHRDEIFKWFRGRKAGCVWSLRWIRTKHRTSRGK